MRNIKHHTLRHAKRIKYFARPLLMPDRFVHTGVPYFCQWESPGLAGQIIKKQISTDDDPNWQASGAKTKEEYHDWSWSACGMACTKMILAHRTGKVVPIVQLGKICAEYGGYKLPLADSIGLYFKPYITFVDKEFGWKAKIVQGMGLQELMYELGKGNYVIAGVSPQIHHPTSKPRVKSGHLVLMLGYDQIRQELYMHNSSGISKDTQEYAAIGFSDFKKFFGGQCLVIQGDSVV